VSERIKILREIERLTVIIDSMTSRMNYLKDRANYSTITLELQAVVKDVVRQYSPSPFAWIANLKPGARSLYNDEGDLTYENPSGFFYMKKEFFKERRSAFLFITPDQKNGIRAGTALNYPPADMQFWKEAFEIDMKNRMYGTISSDEIKGNLTFTRMTFKMGGDNFYTVAFAVEKKHEEGRIVIIEASFGSEAAYKQYLPAVDRFIKSLGLKK
jgi:hypothetical protein